MDENANDAKQPVKVELEIVRYHELIEMLRQPRMIWRMMITVFILIIIVFFGLAVVVMSIKSIYPYSTITTNVYGATTMGTEDKEVTYWLFNTAEFWANSGIEVHEGDVITVRSSGSWHTAIHHLVENTAQNSELEDLYTGSEGIVRNSKSDAFRAQFRMLSNLTDGSLLMAIFPRENIKSNGDLQSDLNKNFRSHVETICNSDNKCRIYEIGKERRDIKVTESGYLHFSVNDIALTRDNIKKIYKTYLATFQENYPQVFNKEQLNKLNDWVKKWKNDTSKIDCAELENFSDLDSKLSEILTNTKSKDDVFFKFGKRPDLDDKAPQALNNELLYYYDNNFIDAWFADNIGSLLIVVERKTQL